MRFYTCFVILILLLSSLALATEYIGNLSSNPDDIDGSNDSNVEDDNDNDNTSNDDGSDTGDNSGNSGSSSRRSGRSGSSSTSSGGSTTTIITTDSNLIENIVEDSNDSTKEDEEPIVLEKTEESLGINLEEGENFPFSIDDELHTLTLEELSLNSVRFTLRSDPIEDTLTTGQEKSYDLNKDGFNELKVLYLGLKDGEAQFEITKISGTASSGITGAVIGVLEKASWFFLIGIGMIIIALLIVIIVKKK